MHARLTLLPAAPRPPTMLGARFLIRSFFAAARDQWARWLRAVLFAAWLSRLDWAAPRPSRSADHPISPGHSET